MKTKIDNLLNLSIPKQVFSVTILNGIVGSVLEVIVKDSQK